MKNFAILIMLFLGSLAAAKVVVVSDIDDTIKVSHVLDPDSAVGNALKVGNVFRGMSYLYSLIQASHHQTQFFYLTNAPQVGFDRIHARFLEIHEFPNGDLLLRRNITDNEHKIRSLRKIVDDNSGAQFILIGDNGERDPAFYNQIRLERPNENFTVFIREVYSSQHDEEDDRGMRLFPGQIGFVTPIEISLVLNQLNLLHPVFVDLLEQSYVPITLIEAANEDDDGETGTLSFPNWKDCRDFEIPHVLKMRQTALAEALIRRIESRCSIPPFDD